MKYTIVVLAILAFAAGCVRNENPVQTDREYWVESMLGIVGPVFENAAEGTLMANLPFGNASDADAADQRRRIPSLEAFGRSFCGIAPWLNLPDDDTPEGELRARTRGTVVGAIRNVVDPDSPDYLPFFNETVRQPLVDAAFFAHGLLRSRDMVWPALDEETRRRIVSELKSSRGTQPWNNNWQLFSAMIEAALLNFTGECEMGPIERAVDSHMQWYKGDGWYGDGPRFHFDYYNSFVIHPMLTDVLRVLAETGTGDYGELYAMQLKRIVRYADQQERLISPEAAYPVAGRSMAYRFGAFQALSQVALMKMLPEHIEPAQVRCALTAVLKRQLAGQTFDDRGWLIMGFCGDQPWIGESYISTGSLYLCSAVFLPLGLPAADEFWAAPGADWSSRKVWSGGEINRDRAIE